MSFISLSLSLHWQTKMSQSNGYRMCRSYLINLFPSTWGHLSWRVAQLLWDGSGPLAEPRYPSPTHAHWSREIHTLDTKNKHTHTHFPSPMGGRHSCCCWESGWFQSVGLQKKKSDTSVRRYQIFNRNVAGRGRKTYFNVAMIIS